VAVSGGPDLSAVVKTLQERAKTLVEMADGARFYFEAPADYDEAAAAKFLNAEHKGVLGLTIKHLSNLSSFTLEDVENAFKSVMEESGLKFGKIGPTVRVALTGGTISPSIYDVVTVLGKDAVLARLQKALTTLG
jgi:glutamyl-tRNA synthetase